VSRRSVYVPRLVGVRETAHTGGDAEDVVGHRVHEELTIFADGVLQTLEVQGHVIETREVACSGRLMGLGIEGEGIVVNVLVGDTGVVLVRLHETEIRRLALSKTVVAVELKLGGRKRVVVGGGEGKVNHIRGVERGPRIRTVVTRHVTELQNVHCGALTHGPHELLHGMIEVETHLIGLGGLGTSVLELLDEVLMRHLGETLTLLSVKVHVVHEKLHVIEICGCSTALHQLGTVTELDVELHLVVLKRDQRKGKTRVAAEEKLERNVKRGGLQRGTGTHVTTANHLLETVALLLGEGELGPDVEPLAVVLVDALATDLEFHVLDQCVTNRVHVFIFYRGCSGVLFGESHFEPHVGDEVTVAADGASHTVAGLGGTVERLFDGLHREVGVAAVHHLEKGNLGVSCEVNVLSADGNELHKSSTHGLSLYVIYNRKKLSYMTHIFYQ
jgi:hypothetical protein